MHVHWQRDEFFEMVLSRKSLQACYKLFVMVYLPEVRLQGEKECCGRENPAMAARAEGPIPVLASSKD